MADEKILISIEIEKGQNEAEVDNLTKKITNLQAANHNLAKEQQELIKQGKQNSEQYVENSRQIEVNKQKINESIATRKNLITTLVNEDTSIKALNARNAELIKQRNLLSTSTEAGRAAIAEINQELDKNNKTIVENSSALEKQRFNIGNYKSALDGLVPGLGGMVTGIQAGTKAAYAFIATGIGAIIAAVGLAVFALASYFKSSEAGQNRWNKIVAIGSAILEQFMNVIEAVGEAIFDAFTNPQEALDKFVGFLKDQLINRFTGLIELIPKLGEAIKLLFEGEFAEAGTVAGDAMGKVVLGVENATEKVGEFIASTAALVEEGIKNGEKLSAIQAKIDAEERKLIIDRERTALEVGRLRAEALKFEGEERKKVILEAIALEEQLSAREVSLAKLRRDHAQAELETNGDTTEAKNLLAEATGAVFAAEATAFQNTLRLKKEVRALDEEDAKLKEQQAKDAKKAADEEVKMEKERLQEISEAEREQFETNLAFLEEKNAEELNILKEKYLNDLITKQEFETQFTEIELTALEQRLAFLQANGESTVAIETAILNAKLAAKEKAAKTEFDAEKKLAAEKKKLRDAEVSGINASLDAGVALAKEAFGENKAIAVAETVINTVRGIVRAIADFPFPYSLIVSALIGGLGTIQTAKIAGIKFARGGIARSGGVLRGRDHSRGGIPFSVAGQPGFEAEGGEAIINKRSTSMFKRELSAINKAGGGVEFATGGITGGTQTRQAASQAESRTAVQEAVENVMRNFPQIVVTVEDINAKTEEVSTTQQRAQVISN